MTALDRHRVRALRTSGLSSYRWLAPVEHDTGVAGRRAFACSYEIHKPKDHSMPSSLSQASISVFEIGLNGLSGVLDKASFPASTTKR
jgi:hypothetical protein